MADRGLSAGSITELGTTPVVVYNLLRVDFTTPTPSPVYFTDAPHDISYGGNTYLSSANCPQFPSIKETLGIKPNGLSLKFSGTAANHALTLTQNYKNVPVYIYRYINGTGEAVSLFEGFLDSYSTSENKRDGSSEVTWKCVSHWANWEAQNGRYINSTSQARIDYEYDKFFEFTGVTDAVLDYWGGARNPANPNQGLTTALNNAVNFVPTEDTFSFGPTSQDITRIILKRSVYNYEGRKATTLKLPVVYGQNAVIGTPIFRALSGTDLKYLWVVYALSEGECDSLTGNRIQIGDDGIAFDNAQFNSKILHRFYSGSDNQSTTDAGTGDAGVSATDLVTASVSWTTSHDGNGICYCIVRYEYDVTIFDNGVPEPVFILKGKKCIDPNNTGNPAAFTNNPAWILYDYLSNERYGKGIPTANLIEFDSGATYADTTGYSYGTSLPIPFFEFTGAIDTNNSIKKNAETILFSMRAALTWVGGDYKLVIERHDGYDNLLLYSEAFDNSYWDKTNLQTLIPSVITDPFGGLNGWVVDDQSVNWGNISNNSNRISAPEYDVTKRYTASVFIAKDATDKTVRYPMLRIICDGHTLEEGNIEINTSDLNDYDVSASQGGLLANVTGGVEDWGNWVRIWVSYISVNPNTNCHAKLFPAVGAYTTYWAWDATTTGSVDAFGLQVVEGDSAGIYYKTEGTSVGSVYSFDEDNTSGEFGVSETGIKQLLNVVEYEFIDPLLNYASDTVYADSVLYLGEDNGRELKKKISNKFEQNRYRAQNRAETILKSSRENISGKLGCVYSDALQIECGDIIDITRDTQGFVNKKFRVTGMTLSKDGSVIIDSFSEYTPEAFDWSVSTEVTLPADTQLLNPNTVVAPTSLTLTSGTGELFLNDDGTVISRIKATWVASADAYVDSYNIYINKAASGQVFYRNVPNNEALIYIDNVEDGVSYEVSIEAQNSLKKKSTQLSDTHVVVGKTAPPDNVGNFVATITGSNILFTWDAVSDIDIGEYEIRQESTWSDPANKLDSTKALTLSHREPDIGSIDYIIKAIDTSLNESVTETLVNIVTTAPTAPIVTLSYEGENVLISFSESTASFPIDYYEIQQGDGWDTNSTTIAEVKGLNFTKKVDWLTADFFVGAWDVNGNLGSIGSQTSTIIAPFEVTAPPSPNSFADVIDNNVLLRWTEALGTLPIKAYEIKKGTTFGTAVVLQEIKGTFATFFENVSGTYKYWVVGIDTAGNYGTEKSVTALVSQPPDFILNANWLDDFSGTKVNSTIDTLGRLVATVNTTETWADHYVNNSWTTIAAQVSAGYPIYIEPSQTTGSYSQDFDYGGVLASTLIKIIYDSDIIDGGLTITPNIKVKKLIGDSWTDKGNVLTVFATDFRYVQVTLTFTSAGGDDITVFNSINLVLDSKLRNDAGTSSVTVASTGVWVAFNVTDFVDITAIQVTPNATVLKTAIYDYDGTSIIGFQVYLYDSAGAKTTGEFSWTARGY